MDVKVAIEATWELRKHGLAMLCRNAMTGFAIRNLAMLLVAFTTSDLSMLACCVLPFGIDVFMTIVAGSQVDVLTEGNHQGLMNVMTRCTIRHFLVAEMRLVTLLA